MAARKLWSNLAPSSQARFRREGITPAQYNDYQRKRAQGHRFTPGRERAQASPVAQVLQRRNPHKYLPQARRWSAFNSAFPVFERTEANARLFILGYGPGLGRLHVRDDAARDIANGQEIGRYATHEQTIARNVLDQRWNRDRNNLERLTQGDGYIERIRLDEHWYAQWRLEYKDKAI